MFAKLCLLVLVGSCSLIEATASLAPFVQPCIPGDTECYIRANTRIALSHLAEGIPEFGIAGMEPVNLRNITMDQGYVKLVFPDVEIRGGRRCIFEDVQLNFIQSTLSITMNCPVEATGSYKFNGRFSFLDLNNEGDYIITSDSVRITVTSKIDTVLGHDGNSYWSLSAYDYSYEPIENLYVNLGGLFVGNIAKAQPFLKVISNEWWPTIAKIIEPLTDAAVGCFQDNLRSLFLRLPLEQLSK